MQTRYQQQPTDPCEVLVCALVLRCLLLLQVLKPAIQLADTGFAVSPITAYHWGKSAYAIRKQGCTEAAAGALLQANGQAPVAGQRWCNKHMAATLQRVAQLGAKEGEQRLPW